MEYFKLFETQSEYQAYVSNIPWDKLPNISYCVESNEPYTEGHPIVLVARYNVTSTTEPTRIGFNAYTSGVTAIEIDGVRQPSVTSAYTFNTLGEHRIEYKLLVPTNVSNSILCRCYQVYSVTIPKTILSIDAYAFQTCSGLTSITIPSGVTSIGKYALYQCSAMTRMNSDVDGVFNIPNKVNNIGDSAFGMCHGLTSITIPNSVTSIGGWQFQYCSGLTGITIPSSVTSIGQSILLGSNVNAIVVDPNNTVYDSRNNCNAIIKTSNNQLIQGCKNTVIPNTVTSIGRDSFYGTTELTNINIPTSVTSIGVYAFESCSKLSAITIPSSITAINKDAFHDCGSLSSVTCLATTPPTLGSNVFNDNASGRKIYVPSGSLNAYKTATNWKTYAADILPIA